MSSTMLSTDDNQEDSSAASSSSSSSWDYEETRPQEEESTFSFENEPATSESVPADQERQVLLVMLLAQVCALHDPTPRTFTVHVLELFERGILDRDSIRFLFDLGLVPSSPTNLLLPPSTTTEDKEAAQLALISKSTAEINSSFHSHRSMEASAIRMTLEHLEQQQHPKQQRIVGQSSWSVEKHPLSLSRFQREFSQVSMLAAGAFGQVFRATNKMDGREYAIKRVAFTAEGYSQESVDQVVREVHCLAVCDHPNVVRYYTSWLEPSWMTGSGKNVQHPHANNHGLLTGMRQSGQEGSGDSASDDLHDYFKDPSFSDDRKRSYSMDNSFGAPESSWGVADNSVWTEASVDDSFLPHPRRSKGKGQPKYSYMMNLYLQMQLCHPTSLADWIRERNQKQIRSLDARIKTAGQIFEQIAAGLKHVHQKGIIHRDLKPANVFASVDDGIQFKIGDFGLSKLIESAANPPHRKSSTSRIQPLLIELEEDAHTKSDDDSAATRHSWKDPLTAGVGTASYAAPEQVSSRSYGTAADIFSLGLVLLELVCCFSTEHERLQTFRDCREDRVLPADLQSYPILTETILSCTEKSSRKRPSADDLLGLELHKATTTEKVACLGSKEDSVQLLRKKLVDKDRELERCRSDLAKKDKIIEDLYRQLEERRREQST